MPSWGEFGNRKNKLHLKSAGIGIMASRLILTLAFNCTRPLMYQLSQPKQVAMEHLGIVERIPAERTCVAWRLAELEQVEGADIIRGLNFSLSE